MIDPRTTRTQVVGSTVIPISLRKETLIIPDEIQVLLLELKRVNNLDRACSLIKDSKIDGLKELDKTRFEYKGFNIQISLKEYSDEYVNKLSRVNELGVNCAPLLVDHLIINDTDSITVTFYPGCEKELPKSYSELLPHGGNLDVKSRFLKDIEKLVANGLSHNLASDDYNEWLVNNNGEIILDGWEFLTNISPDDSSKYISSIKRLLGFDAS